MTILFIFRMFSRALNLTLASLLARIEIFVTKGIIGRFKLQLDRRAMKLEGTAKGFFSAGCDHRYEQNVI